jgi:hypothetical protein
MKITDRQRNFRSLNIAASGGIEDPCPACNGKGEIRVKDTRVIGSMLKQHLADGHHDNCRCKRTTVSRKRRCVRCGGFGTVPR